MDFVRNRQFRQTLLCHDSLQPARALRPDVLHGLMGSSAAVPDSSSIDRGGQTPIGFTNGKQRAGVTRPATKAALGVLTEAWPGAIEVDALSAIALERAAPFLDDTPIEDARSAMLEDLFGGAMYGLIALHTLPPA